MILNENNIKFNIKENNILNEQYYGGNEYTRKIDSLFEEAIDLCRQGNKLKVNTALQNVSIRLEDVIKEMFNFAEVDVQFREIIGTINAYTADHLNYKDIKNGPKYNKKRTKYGIQYIKPIKSLRVTIGNGLLRQPEMTGRMASSILFHEIGHNFFFEDSQVYVVNKYSLVALLCMGILTNPIGFIDYISDTFSAYLTKSNNENQKKIGNSLSVKISNTLTTLKNIELTGTITLFGLIFTPINKLVNKLTVTLNKGIKTDNPGYRNEQFADNFATTYGYGKEVIQVQKLFLTANGNKFDDMIQRNKFFGRYMDWVKNSLRECDILTDVHPDNVARCIDQIKYLEANLKYIKNPEEKKKIKKDLEDLNRAMQDVKKLVDKNGELERKNKTTLKDKVKHALDTEGGEAYKNNIKRGLKNGQWDALV